MLFLFFPSFQFFLNDKFTGGYSHAPDKLTYGVDMKQIRWCGILQVRVKKSNRYAKASENKFYSKMDLWKI